MKLRNLIFALFLAIGAIGFTACTGDDGEQGPAGPAGPPGPAGEVTEADIPEDTSFYNFLKVWGSPTGEVACSSPLLTGSGPLPGPDALAKLTAPLPTGVDTDHVVAACTGFSSISATDVNMIDDVLDLADDAFTATAGLVFIKTGKGQEVSTDRIAATEFNQPTETTTTKTFVGGKVFADMDAGTSDEALERLDLYSECGVGTAPTNLAGTWRAVTIQEDPVPYVQGVRTPPADPAVVRTVTLKVCVNFDAIPGVTKCYVDVNAPGTANDAQQVAIYDGANLHTVLNDMMLGTDAAGDVSFITASDVTAARLCRLF